jgi:hypothetical protein
VPRSLSQKYVAVGYELGQWADFLHAQLAEIIALMGEHAATVARACRRAQQIGEDAFDATFSGYRTLCVVHPTTPSGTFPTKFSARAQNQPHRAQFSLTAALRVAPRFCALVVEGLRVFRYFCVEVLADGGASSSWFATERSDVMADGFVLQRVRVCTDSGGSSPRSSACARFATRG